MRRRFALIFAVLSIGLAATVVAAGTGPATAVTATRAAAWRAAETIPGQADLADTQIASLSCASAGNCGAGGYYTGSSDRQQAFVASQVNGVWRPAEEVPGLAALNVGGRATVLSVSCGSAGNCGAVGYYTLRSSGPVSANGNFQAFVVNETGGTWGAAQLVPGLAALNKGDGPDLLWSVSCVSAGNCAAGGTYTTNVSSGGDSAFVVTETGGRWGTAEEVPGVAALGLGTSADVVSVSCTAPGDCSAGGDYAGLEYHAQPFVVTETGGSWGHAQAVAGASAIYPDNQAAQTVAVSCASAGDCGAVGDGTVNGHDWPFVVTETGGTWGTAEPVPGLAALDPGHAAALASVSCGSPGNCSAGGDYTYAVAGGEDLQMAFVVNEVGGAWQTALPVPGLAAMNSDGSAAVSSVSCVSAGTCSAVGDAADGAFAVDESNGVWGAAHLMTGDSAVPSALMELDSVSCVSSAACGAAGFDLGGAGVVADKSVPRATGTVMSLSTAKVTYGDERAERVTVAVSGSGWTPAGTVAVRAGATLACTVTLADGRGSCLVPAARFAAGPVGLTASYGGAPWFASSVSAAKSFTVARATTKTSLALSAAKVTYGRERSERLTVTVAPRYAGSASGTVTIKSGRKSVCLIRLSSGRGSCTLTARQLKPATYRLIASWPASRDFDASASAAKTLTVAG